jgi:DNA-binding transcriptional LysR family regulator
MISRIWKYQVLVIYLLMNLTCTVDLASQSLTQAVAAFSGLHPELQIELVSSDRVVIL